MDYLIRPIHKSEYHMLEDFQYEALFIKEGEPPFPRSIIKAPVFWNYITNFGKTGDFCLVAEVEGKAVGAVWGGFPCGEVRGYV